MDRRLSDEDRRLIGRVIGGKLRIVEHLGSGSMGRVYRAHHLGLDKDVAIKVLRDSAVPDPNRSKRFAREARAASRLNHPNSVAVLDFGEDGDDKLLYIAMEFLEGEDLQALIDRGERLELDRICLIMIQVLAALAAAHDAGIIHRDMKPSNVVLVKQRNDEGLIAEVVKVCDFGVAKFQSESRDTFDGAKGAQRVIGTPLYMSPEQAVGDRLDPRTDIYSCGVIMYEMLTGQPPFTAETPMGVLMKHVSEPLVPPSERISEVPPELDAVIRWSLEKKRERRPPTARDLRTALRACLAGQSHTIEALARYGIEVTPGARPWSGPTPYGQVDLGGTAGQSTLLAAPPTPQKPTSAPRHPDLIADLQVDRLVPALVGGAPLHGAAVPTSLLEPGSGPDEREIFSERSFFSGDEGARDRVTVDLDQVALDAPPPRSLSRLRDTDPRGLPVSPEPPSTPRFGLTEDRRAPRDGLWLRGLDGVPVGPCSWSEVTHALRLEAARGRSDELEISADRATWLMARRFAELTGVEALLEGSGPLPEGKPTGRLEDRSTASLFAELTELQATGRMAFRADRPTGPVWFEIHLDRGRPTLVATNEPHLQLPDLLVRKGVLVEADLPRALRPVLEGTTTLETAVGQHAEFDLAHYRNAVMKERLRHLLRWPDGQFGFDSRQPPASRKAFALSLLSILPDLVYRTLPTERLEAELRPLLDRAPRPVPGAGARLADMGLTRSQRGVAERILSSTRLGDVLPPTGRVRKAYTTLAYVLREAGLYAV